MTTNEARTLLQQPTLTVEQFAEMFRLSKAGAYDAIAREEIAVTRIGAAIRVLTKPLASRLGLLDYEEARAA